jgi:hypothetical protein
MTRSRGANEYSARLPSKTYAPFPDCSFCFHLNHWCFVWRHPIKLSFSIIIWPFAVLALTEPPHGSQFAALEYNLI